MARRVGTRRPAAPTRATAVDRAPSKGTGVRPHRRTGRRLGPRQPERGPRRPAPPVLRGHDQSPPNPRTVTPPRTAPVPRCAARQPISAMARPRDAPTADTGTSPSLPPTHPQRGSDRRSRRSPHTAHRAVPGPSSPPTRPAARSDSPEPTPAPATTTRPARLPRRPLTVPPAGARTPHVDAALDGATRARVRPPPQSTPRNIAWTILTPPSSRPLTDTNSSPRLCLERSSSLAALLMVFGSRTRHYRAFASSWVSGLPVPCGLIMPQPVRGRSGPSPRPAPGARPR